MLTPLNVLVFQLGKPTDVWALGCILYQMIYGHLPFSDFTNHPAKIAAICSPRHQIPYPTISIPKMPASSSSTISILGPNVPAASSSAVDPKTLASPVDPLAIQVMSACHLRDEKLRPTIGELIEHDFLKPWKRTCPFFLFLLFFLARGGERRVELKAFLGDVRHTRIGFIRPIDQQDGDASTGMHLHILQRPRTARHFCS